MAMIFSNTRAHVEESGHAQQARGLAKSPGPRDDNCDHLMPVATTAFGLLDEAPNPSD